MVYTTTVRSWPAIGLGAVFVIATGAILLWDVRSLAAVTVDHVITVGTLFGTIVAGHFIIPAFKQAKILAGLGLVIAFCAGTFMCVSGSAGRGGEAIDGRQAEARKINDTRKRLEDNLQRTKAGHKDALEGNDRDLKEAKTRYQAALIDEELECGTGDGAKCKAKRSTTARKREDVESAEAALRKKIEELKTDVARAEAALAEAKAPAVANGKIKKAAELWGIFSSRAQADREAALELIWPFANALIWELLSLVFFNLGLGHEKRHVRMQGDSTSNPFGSQHRCPTSSRATDPLVVALKLAGRPVSNDELAALVGVDKNVSSKRVSKLVLAGVVRRDRVGRHVAISIANDRLH